jgi:hypothetical protein
MFFLSCSLRFDNQEVENQEDKAEHKEHRNESAAAGSRSGSSLKKETKKRT